MLITYWHTHSRSMKPLLLDSVAFITLTIMISRVMPLSSSHAGRLIQTINKPVLKRIFQRNQFVHTSTSLARPSTSTLASTSDSNSPAAFNSFVGTYPSQQSNGVRISIPRDTSLGLESHIQFFAHYHLWSTRTLLNDLSSLSDADFSRDVGLFFGSIHGTLSHIVACDRLWSIRLIEGVKGDTAWSKPLWADEANGKTFEQYLPDRAILVEQAVKAAEVR